MLDMKLQHEQPTGQFDKADVAHSCASTEHGWLAAAKESFRGDDELDPTRAFVRTAVKYYDERWRWMDWSGQHRRWNGAAAFGGPVWLAYRRMKPLAAVYLAWIAFAAFAYRLGMPVWPLLVIQITIMLAAGFYGTFLYGRRFRHEIKRAFREHHNEQERAVFLRRHGGFSFRAALGALIGLPLVAVLTFWAAGEVVADAEKNRPPVDAFLLDAEG